MRACFAPISCRPSLRGSIGQRWPKEADPEAVRGADAHGAREHLGIVPQIGRCLDHFVLDPFGMLKQYLPGGKQDAARGRAVEELLAQVLLQVADTSIQRCLRHIQLP